VGGACDSCPVSREVDEALVLETVEGPDDA